MLAAKNYYVSAYLVEIWMALAKVAVGSLVAVEKYVMIILLATLLTHSEKKLLWWCNWQEPVPFPL